MAGRMTVERFLRRRRLWGRAAVLLVLAGLVLARVIDGGLGSAGSGDVYRRYHDQSFRVVEVIDGDTLLIDAPDGQSNTTKLRLWGIDCPEVAKPWAGKEAEPFADEATALTRELCEGQTVRLELQAHQLRGQFDRVLVYVQLSDGTWLNERLLLAGLARWESRFPHDRMERYRLLAEQARHDGAGMWAEGRAMGAGR